MSCNAGRAGIDVNVEVRARRIARGDAFGEIGRVRPVIGADAGEGHLRIGAFRRLPHRAPILGAGGEGAGAHGRLVEPLDLVRDRGDRARQADEGEEQTELEAEQIVQPVGERQGLAPPATRQHGASGRSWGAAAAGGIEEALRNVH